MHTMTDLEGRMDMNISFEGIGEVIATFLAEEDSKIKPGDVVCLTGNNQVGLGQEGDIPCGVAATVSEDGCVAVQISGLAEIACSGSAPAAGWNTLAADGTGSVKVVTAGSDGAGSTKAATGGGASYLVVSVDTVDGTAVVKL